jgi:polyisoprenoid-binding protein YceI
VTYDLASGAANGEIVVDAASGETGNGSRDKRMQSVVLESQRFPDAVFRIEGVTAPATVRGTLTLHGADHPISVPMTVSGNTYTGTFDVPYTAWGMKDASQLLLRVNPVVKVELKLVASN